MKSLINEILTLERKYFNDKKQNNFKDMKYHLYQLRQI